MIRKLLPLIVLAAAAAAAVSAQTASTVTKHDLSPAEVERIVKKFTENEALFREALSSYVFNRYAAISTIGMGGQVTGVFRRDSFMNLDASGKRTEKVLFAPISTLTEISLEAEDIENMKGIDAFGIEPKTVGQYAFTYLGKEKIDELNLFVFDVAPKTPPDWKKGEGRLFQGRIWVDDEDLMIVKSRGKAVPEKKQRFPTMESIRQNVDGKYWFPSHIDADDELIFSSGQAVKIRVRMRFKDYSLGRSEVRLVGDEEIVQEPAPTPSPTPAKKPL